MGFLRNILRFIRRNVAQDAIPEKRETKNIDTEYTRGGTRQRGAKTWAEDMVTVVLRTETTQAKKAKSDDGKGEISTK